MTRTRAARTTKEATIYTPKPEQQEVIDRLATEPTRAALVNAGTGFGKTLVAVELAKKLDARVVLVIAPINTFDGWKATVERQWPGTPARVIKNTDVGKAIYDDLVAGVPGVYIVGTQTFAISATNRPPNPEFIMDAKGVKKPHPKPGQGARKKWTSWSRVSKHIDLAVLDESHKASNKDSLMFKVLRTLTPGYRLAMSATPSGNRFEGIWAPCRWLWPEARNGRGQLYVEPSFWKWVTANCKTEKNPHSDNERSKIIKGERIAGRFVRSLPCYLYYKAPKKPTDTLRAKVELTPVQRKMYDDMEKLSVAWLQGHPLVEDLPIVQKTRLRQMALGEVTLVPTGETDEFGLPEVVVDFADDCASSKIDACHKIIARHPDQPIIFYTDSQKFARVAAKRLGGVEWSGKVSPKKREQIKADFLDGKIKYLVASISAFGTGTDLFQTVCNIEVWINKSFNGVDNEQAEGRLNRTGQDAERITRYELLAEKSDDEKYLNTLIQQAKDNRNSLAV